LQQLNSGWKKLHAPMLVIAVGCAVLWRDRPVSFRVLRRFLRTPQNLNQDLLSAFSNVCNACADPALKRVIRRVAKGECHFQSSKD
jgi:hypothetical protein